MEIRKGPFGHYAIYSVSSSERIFTYAFDLIASRAIDSFLPVYITPYDNKKEIAFDFSGMIPIDEIAVTDKKKKNTILNNRRKNIGDLFCLLSTLPDLLISPSCIVLDPHHIYTDPTGEDVKICCAPLVADSDQYVISSVDKSGLDDVLAARFFAEVLSMDERQAIMYAFDEDDMQLLMDTGKSVKNNELISGRSDNNDKSGTELIYIFFFAMTSLIAMIMNLHSLCALLFIASIAAAAAMGIKLLKKHKLDKTTDLHDLSNQRKQILFDDEGARSVKYKRLILKSVHEINGEIFKTAIYTESAIIGSDKFLSDIFVDDKSISSIHAEFIKRGDQFYIKDLSADNSTFLENRRLESERYYEIKNAQRIRCGAREFEISC